MAQNEPQRKETPPGPSPNSPSLLCKYQCRSGKFITLANRIETFFARIGMLYYMAFELPVRLIGAGRILKVEGHSGGSN